MLQSSIPSIDALNAPQLTPAVVGGMPNIPGDGFAGGTGTEINETNYNITLPGLVVRNEDDIARIKSIVAQAIDETRRRQAY